MPIDQITIIGAGGQAQVVIDAYIAAGGDPSGIEVCDQSPTKIGSQILGFVVRPLMLQALRTKQVHIAIGDNAARFSLAAQVSGGGATLKTIVHPAAVVAMSSAAGDGCFLAAGSVLGPSARLDMCVIVNHNAVVDHECHVGSFCHIAPGATLAGNVVVGSRVLVGAGANVMPGLSIGDDAVIGASALVRAAVAANTVVVGVPAGKLG